jgi:uncharacterized protein (DUF4415 family)
MALTHQVKKSVVRKAKTALPTNNPWAGKAMVGIRLDVDVLNWFKSAGPGYQTRINAVLRREMEGH